LGCSGDKMQDTSEDYNIDNFITLLNFIADPVIIIDEKGNFLLMNKSFEKVTGYKNEEYIGKPSLVTDKLSSENKALLKENMQKRISGSHVAPYEVTFLDINKGNRVFEINAKKIKFKKQPSIP
jgi:PAS domain S-box-containing protein